jgi:hypothetical protein
MNVRFSDRHIRFRVAQHELELLVAGRSLSLDVAMPRSHQFRASVNVTPLGDWQLDSDPTGLWLSIPRSALEDLQQSLPRKEGLQRSFPAGDGDTLEVSFQVDLRKENKAAA